MIGYNVCMEHTYSPKQFGKLIRKSVNTLQKWDRKGILPTFRSTTNRRYYTHEQYLQYRGLIASEQELVIAYQDRFVRFGYDWFEHFCERHGSEITIMNGETFSLEAEVIRDLIAIMTVFSAWLLGLRSHKNLIRVAASSKGCHR